MSKMLYNSEKINDYLLGSLPAEETEQLDELSITDAEFAGALVAAESELIDAYVLNELDEETLRKFERRYLSTPVKRDKVEFAKTLQQFGRQESPAVVLQPQAAHWLYRLKSLLNEPSVLKWGFATVVFVLLAAAIWLAFQNVRLGSEVLAIRTHNNKLVQSQQQLEKQLDEAERSAQAIIETPGRTDQDEIIDHQVSSTVLSLVLAPSLRGTQQKPTVNLNRDTTALKVRLELEPNEFSSYRVDLLSQGQTPVWHAVNLKAQGHQGARSLMVMLPGRVLKVHDYVLRVSGAGQDAALEVIGDYAFAIGQTHRAH